VCSVAHILLIREANPSWTRLLKPVSRWTFLKSTLGDLLQPQKADWHIACVGGWFLFFIVECHPTGQLCYILFDHFSVDDPLDFFHFLSIMNYATMKICVQFFIRQCLLIFLESVPGLYDKIMFTFLRNWQSVFSRWLYHFTPAGGHGGVHSWHTNDKRQGNKRNPQQIHSLHGRLQKDYSKIQTKLSIFMLGFDEAWTAM
jgi:hypothetical protein